MLGSLASQRIALHTSLSFLRQSNRCFPLDVLQRVLWNTQHCNLRFCLRLRGCESETQIMVVNRHIVVFRAWLAGWLAGWLDGPILGDGSALDPPIFAHLLSSPPGPAPIGPSGFQMGSESFWLKSFKPQDKLCSRRASILPTYLRDGLQLLAPPHRMSIWLSWGPLCVSSLCAHADLSLWC